jgi:outer membrane protein
MKKVIFVLLVIFSLVWTSNSPAQPSTQQVPLQYLSGKPSGNENYSHLSLNDCLNISLKNNHLRPASRYALQMSEDQHKQAMSAYWPQLSLRSVFSQFDQYPNFIFPARSIPVPGQTVTLPANSFGPGVPPGPVPLTSPPTQFSVPQQNVKLMDSSNLLTSLNLSYPLYAGGLRRAKVNQAEKGVEVAKEEVRRTDLQVIYDVKKMYYGAVLAQKVYQIGKDSLDRLQTTLILTEDLYKRGSGKVKKTDYLRSKATVETVRTMVADLANNVKLAKAGLVNTMGLAWQTAIGLAAQELPYSPLHADLAKLVSTSYEFNPDWAKLKAGLEAAEFKIKEEQSGHLPKIALTGNLNHIDNPYNQGIVTSQNKNFMSVGVALEIPIFSGFLTQYKVREARANVEKIKEQRVVLKEGLALQVKDAFLRLMKAQEQQQASKEALLAALENRELNEKAYRDELVDTKDVLEAQVLESTLEAQYQKILYDHIEALAQLNLVVGAEISHIISPH